MKLIAIHTVKHEKVMHAPGTEFEVKSAAVSKALIAEGAARQKTKAIADDEDTTPKSVAEVLAMADAENVSTAAFKAAAGRLLTGPLPAKKEEIVAALKAMQPAS